MNNSLMQLTVRPVGNPDNPTWVFDDERFGLKAEPFVAGAETAITKMAISRSLDITKQLLVTFSANAFPDSQCSFKRLKGDKTGTDYLCVETKEKAWLCPALFFYFPEAPERIFAKVEQATESQTLRDKVSRLREDLLITGTNSQNKKIQMAYYELESAINVFLIKTAYEPAVYELPDPSEFD